MSLHYPPGRSLGSASLFLMAVLFSLLASGSSAQSGYPSGESGYPGGGSGYPGAAWQPQPCDANGNILTNFQQNTGVYDLTGTQYGQAANTYDPHTFRPDGPPPAVSCLFAIPTYSPGYLYTGRTVPTTDIGTNAEILEYVHGIDDNVAFNSSGSSGFLALSLVPGKITWIPETGQVTTDIYGRLWFYFKMVWSGSGTPTTPCPDHLNVLLRTDLTAGAYTDLNGVEVGANQGPLLHAHGIVTDGPPFNETAEAPGPVPSVQGRHLLHVPVDSRGIATVSLGGEVHRQAVALLPWGHIDAHNQPVRDIGEADAYASASVSATVQVDSREVTISCPGIETSYYKGAIDALHPTGQWPHIPNVMDGSMAGDTAVVGTTGGHWKNGAGTSNSFIANTPGFTYPYFLWSKSGSGTPDSQTASYLGVSDQLLSKIPMNLDFGTEPSTTSDPNTVVANNPFPLSIIVRTDVKDGPGTDGATAANTYTVTYHLPFENPVKYGPEIPDDTPEQTTGNLAINTLPIVQIPAKVEAVDLADGAHIAGGVATAVSAGLPLIKIVAQVTEPELIIAQTVFAVFGYTLGLAPDAKPETEPVPVATNYAEFKADVVHQVAINQQPVGQKDMVRFEPTNLAEIVKAQLQADPANWQKDPYFWPDPLRATLSVSAKIYRTAKKQSVQGNGYGLNGYQGPKFHNVRAEGGFYTVTHWIYTGPASP